MTPDKNFAQAEMQEEEYGFPYHYLASTPAEGFCQHRVDSWGINYISTIEFLIERLNESGLNSLVDIGCGDGRFTREVARRTAIGNVVGLDFSARAIQLAQAMNQEGTPRFVQQDITEAHHAEAFDAAVLMEVLEHIPLDETRRFVQSVRAILKPGGKLFLTVPHSNKPVEYKHFQHFSFDSIRASLEPEFSITEIKPFEKRGFRRRVLRKLLCNRIFVLNNRRLLRHLYNWHQKNLFDCASESQCQRIFVEAVRD